MKAGVYFGEDEPALARSLDEFLAALAQRLAADSAVAEATVALLLSGGYGRGEGGVFRDAEGRAGLYNDLEFYLLMRDDADEAPVRAWCEREEREGTAALGIDVEFKRLPHGALRGAAPSMFYYDLWQGHRLVWGDETWRDHLDAQLGDATLIPLHEATRLLFNRGSGLFYSRCALAKQDERVGNGFVERNHAKVRLALGDAVLALNGTYHHFARERNRRITAGQPLTPPGWSRLVAWHAEGTEFKLRPRHRAGERATLDAAQAELAAAWLDTFLWLEGRRLGATFTSAMAYAEWNGRLFPETSRMRNVALRLRDRRSRGGALPGWTDYPRAALQRTLVGLVDPAGEPDPRVAAARLGEAGNVPTWAELEPAFARWWAFYN